MQKDEGREWINAAEIAAASVQAPMKGDHLVAVGVTTMVQTVEARHLRGEPALRG